MIGRSQVQIPAPGRAELHVKVSLSKILISILLISEGDLSREYPSLAKDGRKGISSYGQ